MNSSAVRELGRPTALAARPEDPLQRLTALERGFHVPPILQPLLCRVAEQLGDGLAPLSPHPAVPLRAALALLWAGLGRADLHQALPLATAAEMIYHSMRCQREALRSDTRDAQAILSRDLTLARALALFTGHGDLPTMDAISHGAICLSEALLDDLEPSSNPLLRARKLGDYLGSCCQVGALAAGLSAGGQRLAVAYGHLLMDPQAPTWEPNGHLPPIVDSPEAAACFHALQELAAAGR